MILEDLNFGKNIVRSQLDLRKWASPPHLPTSTAANMTAAIPVARMMAWPALSSAESCSVLLVAPCRPRMRVKYWPT